VRAALRSAVGLRVMSDLAGALVASLDDADLAALAERLAPRLRDQVGRAGLELRDREVMGGIARLEPWIDKRALAAHLGCGERWIEYRIRERMPACKIAGRLKFRASEVEAWLVENDYMERVQ
jgi:hypothetical protein